VLEARGTVSLASCSGACSGDAFARGEDLAGDLNAVIASPAFAPWRKGVPLDVGAWLSPGPRTPITVLYLAHLDEPQRLFFLTLLLHQVVSWSRRLPGHRSQIGPSDVVLTGFPVRREEGACRGT
jgi:hypothetical protein